MKVYILWKIKTNWVQKSDGLWKIDKKFQSLSSCLLKKIIVWKLQPAE